MSKFFHIIIMAIKNVMDGVLKGQSDCNHFFQDILMELKLSDIQFVQYQYFDGFEITVLYKIGAISCLPHLAGK